MRRFGVDGPGMTGGHSVQNHYKNKGFCTILLAIFTFQKRNRKTLIKFGTFDS